MSLFNRIFSKEQYIKKTDLVPLFKDKTAFDAWFGQVFPSRITPSKNSNKSFISPFVSDYAENKVFEELSNALYYYQIVDSKKVK